MILRQTKKRLPQLHFRAISGRTAIPPPQRWEKSNLVCATLQHRERYIKGVEETYEIIKKRSDLPVTYG